MSELAWIAEARRHIGLREVKGAKHNQTIVDWLNRLKAWWSDDETAWCGTFVAQCLQYGDRGIPKYWYRAKDYLNYGTRLESPAYGCIVVFERVGGGHVGFVVGRDQSGNLMVLGGNQGDAVNIRPFAPSRVACYRWPSYSTGVTSLPNTSRYNLPIIGSDGQVSNNES